MGIQSPYRLSTSFSDGSLRRKKNRPPTGGRFSIEPLSERGLLFVPIADLAFGQASVTGSPRLTFGARARNFCLPSCS